MNYFIADTHWGDTEFGIIDFERRPFKNQRDMIDTMIDNWNNTVTDDDTVWHLGDVFWELDKDLRKHIINRLNGHKRLVLGNHDREFNTEYWRSIGFEEVYDNPIIVDDFYILSHEPLYMTVGPYVNIFGHVHGNPMYKDYSSISFCACVERKAVNYTPISIEKIKEYLKSTRKIN